MAPRRFATMKLMQVMRLLLFMSTFHFQTPGRSAVTMTHDLSEKNPKEVLEMEEKQSTLQIKSKITVSVILGNATELQCTNKTNEGLVMWWQTPFGSFAERYKFSKKDPLEMSKGNLKILKVTLSHTGLYSCYLVDSTGTTVIAYQVKVLNKNTYKTRTRMRPAREAETATIHYLDTYFAATVASSVLVTFLGAFTLGAFSQPYIIKGLQRTRARICPNKSSHQKTTKVRSHSLRTVFYHREPNSEEDTVHIEFSMSVNARSTIKSNQENQNRVYLECDTINKDAENAKTEESGNESDQPKVQEGAELKVGQGSETITHKQPKRISRVIKLYNYDENGNRFSHIKESEDNPTPRQRVMTLTRLQSIMNEAASTDFSTNADSTERDEGLSMTVT